MSSASAFEYANLTGRPAGPFVAAAARLMPGVATVQSQIRPYAQAWRQANLDAVQRPGPRWVVLGDSMSLGIGASRFDAGWVNQVADRLAGEGLNYEIVNLSASGARVQDVLDMQLPALAALPPRTDDDARPDLVSVMIGANDLLRRANRVGLGERFAELLRAVPVGTVVATLPNPRRAAAEVNVLIARAAAARALRVVDLRAGASNSWRGKLAQDHFHPNDLGYRGLADGFYPAILNAVSTPAAA